MKIVKFKYQEIIFNHFMHKFVSGMGSIFSGISPENLMCFLNLMPECLLFM